VFYVRRAGGTQRQYGIVCSAFALASFAFKPVLGYWSDFAGNKFRAPYLTSIAVATAGAALYFLASAFGEGRVAVSMILAGRVLGGCGAANSSLGYTYITQVIPQEHMTKAGAVLSMVRVFGMTISPGFNALLSKVHFTIHFGSMGSSFEVDPLNVGGLVIVFGNLLGLFTIFFFLKEPPEERRRLAARGQVIASAERGDDVAMGWDFWRNCFRSELLVPILAYFTLNFNFQFMETGLAPAAHLALGWETVAISIVFGIDSLLLFFVYVGTFRVSACGVSDVSLMKAGLVCSVVGYTLMYFWWRRGAMVWMFATPSESTGSRSEVEMIDDDIRVPNPLTVFSALLFADSQSSSARPRSPSSGRPRGARSPTSCRRIRPCAGTRERCRRSST